MKCDFIYMERELDKFKIIEKKETLTVRSA